MCYGIGKEIKELCLICYGIGYEKKVYIVKVNVFVGVEDG